MCSPVEALSTGRSLGTFPAASSSKLTRAAGNVTGIAGNATCVDGVRLGCHWLRCGVCVCACACVCACVRVYARVIVWSCVCVRLLKTCD